MTVWEVLLLMAGFACLCISFFVARGKASREEGDGESRTSLVWTEKEENLIRERVVELLEEEKDELVESAGDQMNHLCNDKIMAIDEFSRQILEKIENNHQEVVFMYNMLSEKEKELSSISTRQAVEQSVAAPGQEKKEKIEIPLAPSQERVVSGTSERQRTERHVQERLAPERQEQERPVPERQAPQRQMPQQIPRQPVVRQSPPVKAVEKKSPVEPRQTVLKQKKTLSAPPTPGKKKTLPDGRFEDVNELIQKMHKEGKSVLEISKALNIGQGEVKLVITLYGGRAK